MSASKGGNSYKNMKKRIILESKSEMCKWSIDSSSHRFLGNQNLYIEEEKTIQWPKKKVQKDKQRS
jgi:hypothetical protein